MEASLYRMNVLVILVSCKIESCRICFLEISFDELLKGRREKGREGGSGGSAWFSSLVSIKKIRGLSFSRAFAQVVIKWLEKLDNCTYWPTVATGSIVEILELTNSNLYFKKRSPDVFRCLLRCKTSIFVNIWHAAGCHGSWNLRAGKIKTGFDQADPGK